MKRKTSSNAVASEWRQLRDEENALQEKLDAARAPLYVLERSLDYCLTYLVDYIGAEGNEDDVAEEGVWYLYKEVIDHATQLVAAGLEQSKVASALLEQMRQIELKRYEVGAPADFRAKWGSLGLGKAAQS